MSAARRPLRNKDAPRSFWHHRVATLPQLHDADRALAQWLDAEDNPRRGHVDSVDELAAHLGVSVGAVVVGLGRLHAAELIAAPDSDGYAVRRYNTAKRLTINERMSASDLDQVRN